MRNEGFNYETGSKLQQPLRVVKIFGVKPGVLLVVLEWGPSGPSGLI